MADQIDSNISLKHVEPDQEEPIIVPRLEIDDEEPTLHQVQNLRLMTMTSTQLNQHSPFS